MKKIMTFVLCVIGLNMPTLLLAQVSSSTSADSIPKSHRPNDVSDTGKIYRFYDRAASPVGGFQDFQRYLSAHLHYPVKAFQAGIEGPVTYQFKVSKAGLISQVKILKDIGGGCGDVVREILEKYPYRWQPAYNNNHLVNSYYVGRINFTLPADYTQKPEEKIYRKVDKQAMPTGGIRKFQKYLSKHTHYPVEALNQAVSGTVEYRFVVDENGQINDVTITKDIGGHCGDAVKQAIESYSKKWHPAMLDGKPVKSYYNGSFTFALR